MTSELELARGALAREPQALQTFEALVRSLPCSDEVRQLVRERALVRERLADFDGRGSLRGWLKTMAARLEVDCARAQRDVAVEDRLLELLTPHHEAELVAAEARVLLSQSAKAALASMTDRERLWIQHHYLDGLTLTQIGKLYAVAPSTVMRALDKAVDELRRLARAHLGATHQLSPASVDSVIRVGAW